MSEVSAVLAIAAVVLVPGWCLASLLGERRLMLLAIVVLGYGWTLGLLLALRVLGLGAGAVTAGYAVCTVALVLWTAVVIRGRHAAGGAVLPVPSRMWPFIIAAVLVVAYQLWAGPYEEVPADYYRHLEYLWEEYRIKEGGGFGSPYEGLAMLGKDGRQWYGLHGWLAYLLSMPPHRFAVPMALFHVSILVLVVVAFALHQFARLRMSVIATLWAAGLAGLLFCLHLGIDVFAFIRYYAIAPAVAAYALYLAGVIYLAEFLQGRRGYGALALWALSGMLAALLHLQEGVFFGIVCFLVAALLVLDAALRAYREGSGVRGVLQANPRALAFLAVMALASGAVWIFAHLNLSRRTPREPLLIPLESVLPFLRHLYILNPTFQFYLVITLWGCAVLALFVLWRKELKSAIVVRAGVFSLLFTGLNPLFVDLFLRVSYAPVLWRMTFIVPLFAVGAWLLARSVTRIRRGATMAARLGHGAVVVVLVALLFPFETTYIVNPHSRIPMLAPLPEENTWRHWSDVVDALGAIEASHQLLTDPVTGYVLSATTHHRRAGERKFLRPPRYILDREDVEPYWFDAHAGKLLVLNRRNGGYSITGERGRHWSPEQLYVEHYYSDHVIDLVASRPDIFVPLWSADQVDVYWITPDVAERAPRPRGVLDRHVNPDRSRS